MTAVRVVVGLGSNVDPEVHLPQAVEALSRTPRVCVEAVSRAWESPPVGAPGTPAFLNAAVLLSTGLPLAELKTEVLRPLEAAAGRVRGPDRCAPRSLDLDIVLYGSEIVDLPEERLVVPDPDLERYAHVAVPAAEVWPDGSHPVSGRSLVEIAAELGERSEMLHREDVDLLAAWRRGNSGDLRA